MHTAIQSVFSTNSFRFPLALGMVALFVLVPILTATAQPEVAINGVFETLIALPDDQLAQLFDLAASLNEAEDAIGRFMESPREFLFNEGVVLPADKFQIIGVSFAVPPAIEDEPWFGIAEPLEGLLFEPKGLGIFYGNVAIFIQEAYEPVEETPAPGEINHNFDMLQFIGDRFPGNTFDVVRDVLRALDEMDPEDPQRLEFLANPREYLIGSLTLPAHSYRIIAIDINRAEAAGSVVSDQIRPGLGTVKEGIGVFYNNVGIFLQRAI